MRVYDLNINYYLFADADKIENVVVNYASQSAAAKGLPFTAAEMALDVVAATINTISSTPINSKSIDVLMQNGFKQEATQLRRLKHLRTSVDIGGGSRPKRKGAAVLQDTPSPVRPKRSRFRRRAHTVRRRVTDLGQKILFQKQLYLESCPYVGIIVDEGNNFSKRCPLYVATISCDPEFRYRVNFIGQADCTGKKDGCSIHELVRKIFSDHDMMHIYNKIQSAGTDGASVMRSTREFAGLDCKGTEGRSFSAHLKRTVKDDMDFWHCKCHQANLGLNDALDSIPALKLYWLPHLRMCHSEFSRSSNNRGSLQDLHTTLKEFDQTYDWKIFYPALFCLTRWVGLYTCTDILSRTSTRTLLKEYAANLRTKGFGPRAFNPYRYRNARRRRDAEKADGDDRAGDYESDDDLEDGEAEELVRVHQALDNCRLDEDGYQPQPQLFPSATAAARSAPSQDDLVACDNFDEGNEDATRFKCKNMLNKHVGLTDLNMGRCCYMTGVLKPYKLLVEELQGFSTPQQHLAARRIRKFYMVVTTGWVGTRTAEPMFPCHAFRTWTENMSSAGKDELVDLIKKECRAFAGVLVASIKQRLSADWNYVQALELIDPLGPALDRYATPEVWAALHDLCERRGIDFDKVQEQIVNARADADQLDDVERSAIRADLCGFLRQ